jgi:HEAT repeat protein
MVKDPSREALDTLLSGLDSKDERLRAAIREALVAKQAEAELLQRAVDVTLPVPRRVSALAGLRVIKPNAGAAVAELLSDREEAVRQTPALALCVFGAEQAEAALIRSLAAEASARVRYFVAVALGGVRSASASAAVTERLATERDVVVRDALGQAQRKQG